MVLATPGVACLLALGCKEAPTLRTQTHIRRGPGAVGLRPHHRPTSKYMSAISGGLSVQVSLCRVRWRTSLPAGFNRLPTGGIHQSETARHKAQERRGRLLPAHSSRQANRGIAQLMKVMLYAKRSTEAVSMTEAASILVDNAPFRRVAYSTWKALGAGDGSGPGPREPTPHSLPIFKKLNELCQKPTPNH